MLAADRSTVGAVLYVLAMVVVAVLARRERLAVAALVLLSLAWFGIDTRYDEVATLLPVAPHHGITVIDLPGVAGIVVAAALARRQWRQR